MVDLHHHAVVKKENPEAAGLRACYIIFDRANIFRSVVAGLHRAFCCSSAVKYLQQKNYKLILFVYPSSELATVSIITPAYDAVNQIARAVDSVLAQTFADWEMLIISDDGRDYASVLTAQGITDPRLRFFSSGAVGAGPNATRNVGLQAAQGDFIAPLDADDFFYPNRLEELLPLAEDYGVATANVDVHDEATNKLLYNPFDYDCRAGEISAQEFMMLSTPMLLVITRGLIRHPWNPKVELGEDTLFNLRCIEAVGGAIPIIYKALHSYRVHAESICHGENAAEKATRAYQYCLSQIETSGLGFVTTDMRAAVKEMLLRKQALNQEYAIACQGGFVGSFQDYYARECHVSQ